jgi:hypothetical protein
MGPVREPVAQSGPGEMTRTWPTSGNGGHEPTPMALRFRSSSTAVRTLRYRNNRPIAGRGRCRNETCLSQAALRSTST